MATVDSRAAEILRRQQHYESERGTWERHWGEVARYVLPRESLFQGQARNPGEQRTEYQFDATAPLSLDRFAAAMESLLIPRQSLWHTLRPADEALAENAGVMAWCEHVNRRLYAARYAPRANFSSQAHETFLSLGAFGTGCLFIDDDIGHGTRYMAIPLSSLWIDEDAAGRPDTTHYRFRYTTRQAAQAYGDALPEAIAKYVDKEPDRKWDFIQRVAPREDFDPRRADFRGMAFGSYTVAVEGKSIVRERGFRTRPFCPSRYMTASREKYGRGPAMTVLPDIKMVNEMSKAVIRGANIATDPPLLLPEDGILSAFSMRPGALNYGGVDDMGRPLVHALNTGARIDIGLDMIEQRRRVIADAFLVTLFQILIETPRMTATEALIRAQEKGALLAPNIGRQQSELLGPMIARELDILDAAGLLPPMPDELAHAGGALSVIYDSPLSRLARAEEGVAIMRTLEAVTPWAQMDPTVMDAFDPEQAVRALASVNGAPQRILRTPEAIAALKEGRAQQAQAEALLRAAPVASGVARDVAQMQAQAGQAPF
ncbi:portal protein [Zavarzinia aquatilis]|uniref:Phage head-tail adapter protein n=1 Tax=Zavarzinia aquatilis TaxID=2211142 RepID=A0A317EIB3_9PROT|nr:portal protein [Zavarzinia aquatilis]PWR24975.1 phage head-tail adapter protein [Zavarzinia aquatilis]